MCIRDSNVGVCAEVSVLDGAFHGRTSPGGIHPGGSKQFRQRNVIPLAHHFIPVSYTHLDVYKRQRQGSGVAAIAQELKDAGVIRSSYLFRWYVGHKGACLLYTSRCV